MMGRSDFLYSGFVSRLPFSPTSCQDDLLRKVADFVSTDDGDILVVNGYAGTGKTTAVSAVISVMKEFQTKCVLLAPTGRAAKVPSRSIGLYVLYLMRLRYEREEHLELFITYSGAARLLFGIDILEYCENLFRIKVKSLRNI